MSRNRDYLKDLALVTAPTYERASIARLQYGQPSSVQLRDGDVVVFRRADNPLWQFRYHIKNDAWHKQRSTLPIDFLASKQFFHGYLVAESANLL
jgi:hypothetical protein